MQKNEILSTLPQAPSTWGDEAAASTTSKRPLSGGKNQPPGPAQPSQEQPLLIFDACQVGVVLRAVLFVETVAAVVAMFHANTFTQWAVQLAILTGGIFPATLLWLVAACMLKKTLQRLPVPLQCVAGVALGVLSGWYGCAMLNLSGLATDGMPWVAGAASGALMSALLVAALVLRAKGRTPADTTARLAELQSRIRPHFLFNTLNSAIALVRQEPAKAESMLEDLADLFRHALMEPGHSVSLEEEIALAQRYLAIEQVRFGDRLQVQWSLDPEAGHARLPPLLLQPLVENAVKHGVEPSPTGGRLRVSTERRGNDVLLRITNTLPLKLLAGETATSTRGHGIALANVRARLALLHDVRGRFHAGMHEGLYQIRIQLPCDNAANP